MDKSLQKLIQDYRKQQNQHPFLLVDLSGGKENTHTNILKSLLQFNDYMFFGSFLTDVLNMPGWNHAMDKVVLDTQRPAVGLKPDKNTNGFIDLYVEYKDEQGEAHIVVIENKVNGAADTKKQMLRYIASTKHLAIDNTADFDRWVKNVIEASKKDQYLQSSIKQDCRNRHFVYLTLDNSKKPEEKSLPHFLYGDEDNPIIDYNPISYQENVLQWLKEAVLRGFPYHDDGIAIAGLRQYIASLERLLSKNVTVTKDVENYVGAYFAEKGGISWDSYVELYRSIGDLERDPDSSSDVDTMDTVKRLARALRITAEKQITEGSVPAGWVIHLSPTLLVLYKAEWMNIARGSYSIPFVSFYASPTTFFKKGEIKWELHIEHFSEKEWKEWLNKTNSKEFKSTNHDRTAYLELGSFDINPQDASGRKKSIETLISQKNVVIDTVDKAVDDIIRNKTKYSDDREIRVALFRLLASMLTA